LSVAGSSTVDFGPNMISRSLAVQVMLEITETPDRLRKLAAWYRDFAELAGNPVIWESRLLMAESLEKEAERVERDVATAARTRLAAVE
jgi:hypothetical protein